MDLLVLPPSTMARIMKQKHGRAIHPRILRRVTNHQVFERDFPRVYPFMIGYGGMGRVDAEEAVSQIREFCDLWNIIIFTYGLCWKRPQWRKHHPH
jgi:hypothetical protein